MTDTNNTIEPIPESNYLAETPASQKSEDVLYNDFFQENSSNDIVIDKKKARSGLELIVTILEYSTIFVVIIGFLSAVHVFIRTKSNTEIFKNYTFICPYLQYDIEIPDAEKGCNSIEQTKASYVEKKKILEDNIIVALTEHIPIKVSSSILNASPEKSFIISAYNSKPHLNDIMEAFEAVKAKVQKISPESGLSSNIKCTGISITQGNTLSTQCVIYGDDIGSNNTNGGIGSARIEALNFMEKLSNTAESSLMLSNFPTSLVIEPTAESGFKTRTTLPIQVTYIPLIEKF